MTSWEGRFFLELQASSQNERYVREAVIFWNSPVTAINFVAIEQTFPMTMIETVLIKVDVMLASKSPASPRSLNRSSLAITR